jgi:hypothetical protein
MKRQEIQEGTKEKGEIERKKKIKFRKKKL